MLWLRRDEENLKGEGFGEIDDMKERNEESHGLLKLPACVKFSQWEAVVRCFIWKQ